MLVIETLEENQVEKPWFDDKSDGVLICGFVTRVSAGSRCSSSSEQNRCSDPNDSQRESR